MGNGVGNPLYSRSRNGGSLSEQEYKAVSIYENLARYIETSSFRDAFLHRGVSMIQMSRMTIEFLILSRVIQKFQIIRELLESNPVERISLIGFSHALLPVLKSVLSVSGISIEPQVFTVPPSHSSGNWKGRVEQHLARLGIPARIVFFLARCLRVRPVGIGLFGGIPSGKPRILAVLEPAGWALETFHLIAQALEPEVSLVAISQKPGLLSGRNMQTWNWRNALTLGDWGRIATKARQLREAWTRLRHEIKFQEQFHFDGADLWPTVDPLLQELVEGDWIEYLGALEVLNRSFSEKKPNLVVVSSQYAPFTRVVLLLAQLHGIPSLLIQPMQINNPFECLLDAVNSVAVADKETRDRYLERNGHEREGIYVTGTPRLDKVARVGRETHPSEVRRELGIGESEKILVFATQPIGTDDLTRMTRALWRVTARYPDCRLVVRPHPREKTDFYERLLSEPGFDGLQPVLVAGFDTMRLVAACDLLATSFSNVALEAAIMGKSVLTMNLTGQPDVLPFAKMGISQGAYSEEEVEEWAERLLCDPRAVEDLATTRNTYFSEHREICDGRAMKESGN
jgi:hypothetical protein